MLPRITMILCTCLLQDLSRAYCDICCIRCHTKKDPMIHERGNKHRANEHRDTEKSILEVSCGGGSETAVRSLLYSSVNPFPDICLLELISGLGQETS